MLKVKKVFNFLNFIRNLDDNIVKYAICKKSHDVYIISVPNLRKFRQKDIYIGQYDLIFNKEYILKYNNCNSKT